MLKKLLPDDKYWSIILVKALENLFQKIFAVKNLFMSKNSDGESHENSHAVKVPISLKKMKQETIDEETIHLIYTEIKDRTNSQFYSIKELESKASRIIGFVGLVTGLGITWIQFAMKSDIFKSLNFQIEIIVYSFYSIGIFFFLLSVVNSFLAYKVEGYRSDPNPQMLAEKYFYKPSDKLMKQLIDNYVDSYNKNNKIMHRKANRVKRSLSFFTLGLAFLFISMAIFLFLKYFELS